LHNKKSIKINKIDLMRKSKKKIGININKIGSLSKLEIMPGK
jgi:hypothetical protein